MTVVLRIWNIVSSPIIPIRRAVIRSAIPAIWISGIMVFTAGKTVGLRTGLPLTRIRPFRSGVIAPGALVAVAWN
jgi:hypothetical protein